MHGVTRFEFDFVKVSNVLAFANRHGIAFLRHEQWTVSFFVLFCRFYSAMRLLFHQQEERTLDRNKNCRRISNVCGISRVNSDEE